MHTSILDRRGDTPYPWGRFLCNICTVLSLGSVVAYSVWGVGYLAVFPEWTAKDVAWIYSFGTLGAFNMIAAGFLYDRVGPMWTYRMGLLLILLGAGGTTLCIKAATRDGFPAKVSMFAFLYFLQETGMATLWTTVSVETVRHFPRHVPLTMGVICACFDLSGVLWASVFSHLNYDIVQSIWLIVGVVATVTLPQFALGPMGSDREAVPEVLWSSYAAAFRSLPFMVFLVVVFVMGPWEVVRGILMQLGTSAGIASKWFVPVTLICAAVGMMGFAGLYTLKAQQWTPLTILMISAAVMLCGSANLLGAAHDGASSSLTWFGAALYYLGAGGLKSASPIWAKERFSPEILGGVEAMRNLLIGAATVFFTPAGPAQTDQPHYFHTLMVTCAATCAAGVFTLGGLNQMLRKEEALPLMRKGTSQA